MSKWISVDERLPEHKQNIMVLNDGVVGMCSYNMTYFFDNIYYGNQETFGHNVTHWMPLPEPPKLDELNAVSDE